jgi:hypothetical protein
MDSVANVSTHTPDMRLPRAASAAALSTFLVAGLVGAGTISVAHAQDADPTCPQHYSWTGEPLDGNDVPPVPPAGSWQANTQNEPHLNNPNVTWLDEVGTGLHYTGEPGRANWFYYEECPEETKEPTPAETKEPAAAEPAPSVVPAGRPGSGDGVTSTQLAGLAALTVAGAAGASALARARRQGT